MTIPIVLIMRGEAEDVDARTFEDDVAQRLAEAGAEVIRTPSLISLPDNHPAIEELLALRGSPLVLSWLYPRACTWLLRYRGLDADAHCMRMGDCESAEAAAETIIATAGIEKGKSGGGNARELSTDAPARRWYPVIDYDACTNCRQCYDFCLFGVYSLDESGRVIVTQPDACKPGCVACARLCPSSAILFPLHEAHAWVAGGPGERPAGPVDFAEYMGGAADEVAARTAEAAHCPAGVEGSCDRSCCPQDAAPRDDLDDLIDALDQLDV